MMKGEVRLEKSNNFGYLDFHISLGKKRDKVVTTSFLSGYRFSNEDNSPIEFSGCKLFQKTTRRTSEYEALEILFKPGELT